MKLKMIFLNCLLPYLPYVLQKCRKANSKGYFPAALISLSALALERRCNKQKCAHEVVDGPAMMPCNPTAQVMSEEGRKGSCN